MLQRASKRSHQRLSLGRRLLRDRVLLLFALPGTALIMAAAFGYKLMLPDHLSWLALALIGGVWLFSILADYAGVLLGTRWFGGSNWGLAGAGGGTLIGMFFSLRAMVLGAIFGAIGFAVAIVTAFVSGVSGVILQTGSLSQAMTVIPNFWPFLANWSTLVLLGYWVIPAAALSWWRSRGDSMMHSSGGSSF